MAPPSTRDLIFHASIAMFADRGYDSVTIKNIADAVGIQPASIYNHFGSKEAILSEIYEYYKTHCFLGRLPLEECEPVLRHGSAHEIFALFNYRNADEDGPDPLMFDIIRIIWSRLYIDEAASAIYEEYVIDAGQQYLHDVLEWGISLGRFSIDREDLDALCTIILANRVFAASALVVNPDRPKWRNTEVSMMNVMSAFLQLNPPLP